MEPRDPTGADQVVEEPLLPPAEQEEQADVPKSRLPPQQRQVCHPEWTPAAAVAVKCVQGLS